MFVALERLSGSVNVSPKLPSRALIRNVFWIGSRSGTLVTINLLGAFSPHQTLNRAGLAPVGVLWCPWTLQVGPCAGPKVRFSSEGSSGRRWKVTEYIYSIAFRVNFWDTFWVLYSSPCIKCPFCISEGNIVSFTAQHQSDSCNYFSDPDFTLNCNL